ITYITKLEFFLAFKAAFFQTFSPENIFRGFRGARLIPYNPQAVLLKLNPRIPQLSHLILRFLRHLKLLMRLSVSLHL
ncbi:hypothetical protein K456DRAFT_1941190, partial [Colletotrichum gloeosporioides 23]